VIGLATAIVVADDLLMRARLESAAASAGFDVAARAVAAQPDEPPAIVLADLDGPRTLDTVRSLLERFDALRVVGFCSHVDRERWQAAESIGVEVHPRGASTKAEDIIRA